jgi:hypothetical protein
MTDRRDAVADDLRALATDLKSLLESATTDPKARNRKERRWRVLYGAFGIVTTLFARRAATKAWTILTGERPPAKGPPQQAATQRSG